MDAWISQQHNRPFDAEGDWANSGSTIPGLLTALLQHPYFSQPLPKSTGREDFNLNWVMTIVEDASLTNEQYSGADVQATLLELSAQSIIAEVMRLPEPIDEIYICGGGAYNRALMARLQSLAPSIPVGDTRPLGIAPEWVEAAAFAWLARQTLQGKPGNLRQATGAHSEVILGAIYPV
jgi:anhydro-N-acetylmuramic acid kinase